MVTILLIWRLHYIDQVVTYLKSLNIASDFKNHTGYYSRRLNYQYTENLKHRTSDYMITAQQCHMVHILLQYIIHPLWHALV